MALNLLEQATFAGKVTLDVLCDLLGEKIRRYDKKGDNHYDTASAFIKSMRGSDADAAIFYLAKMIDGGDYKYPHDFANHFVKQQYLPDEKISARYYEPTEQGAEAAIKRRLETLRQN